MREVGSRPHEHDRDLFLDMAKAWTNIAIVESDVMRVADCELSKKPTN